MDAEAHPGEPRQSPWRAVTRAKASARGDAGLRRVVRLGVAGALLCCSGCSAIVGAAATGAAREVQRHATPTATPAASSGQPTAENTGPVPSTVPTADHSGPAPSTVPTVAPAAGAKVMRSRCFTLSAPPGWTPQPAYGNEFALRAPAPLRAMSGDCSEYLADPTLDNIRASLHQILGSGSRDHGSLLVDGREMVVVSARSEIGLMVGLGTLHGQDRVMLVLHAGPDEQVDDVLRAAEPALGTLHWT